HGADAVAGLVTKAVPFPAGLDRLPQGPRHQVRMNVDGLHEVLPLEVEEPSGRRLDPLHLRILVEHEPLVGGPHSPGPAAQAPAPRAASSSPGAPPASPSQNSARRGPLPRAIACSPLGSSLSAKCASITSVPSPFQSGVCRTKPRCDSTGPP